MSLSWQKQFFTFKESFNEKDDEKTDQPPALSRLENGIFQKSGSIRKRNGYTALGTTDATTNLPITSRGRSIAAREDETILIHEDSVFTHDPLRDEWISRGGFASPILSSATIADKTTNQVHPSQGRSGNVVASAWSDSLKFVDAPFQGSNTVAYEIRNSAGDNIYIPPTVIGVAGLHHPHVIGNSTNLRIWTMRNDASNVPLAIRMFEIDETDPVTANFSGGASGFDVIVTTFGLAYYDVCSHQTDGTSYLIYVDASGASQELVVRHMDASGLVTLQTHSVLMPVGTAIKLVAVSTDPYGSNRVGISWVEQDPAGGLVSDIIKAEILTATLGVVSGVVTIDTQPTGLVTSTTTFIKNLAVFWTSTTVIDVLYTNANEDVTGTMGPYFRTIHTQMNTAGAIVGTAGTILLRKVIPVSKAFYFNGFWFAWFGYQSDLQSTDFLLRSDGLICAKSMQGVAQGFPDAQIPVNGSATVRRKSPAGKYMTEMETISSTLCATVLPFKRRLDTSKVTTMSSADMPTTTLQNNPVYAQQGIRNIELDWNYIDGSRWVEAGDVAYLNGGFLWQYDGRNLTESGFHLFPENYIAAGAVGGPMAIGTYSYRVYFQWVNALGQKEVSSTSGPISVTLVAGQGSVSFGVETLTLTAKSGVEIVIYRTEINPEFDSPFYRVASATNVTTANVIAGIGDTTTDANLVRQELDPLNGGQLDNIALPAPTVLAEGKDRIFAASLQDDSLVRFSKVRASEGPFEFNDALQIALEDGGGQVTAILILNEAVVIFKRTRIYVVSGEGPNNLGFGTFSSAQRVSSDVGAVSNTSVVQTPLGIMFESTKGIYLLDQQFRLNYIGASVEDSVGTVQSAVLMTENHRVLFLCSSGATVAYDLYFGTWSIFTNHLGLAGVLSGGILHYLRTDKLNVYKESTTAFLDAGTAIQLLVRPGPYKPEGLQGFFRCRKLELSGNYKSTHRLIVGIRYDYSTGAFTDYNYDPDTAAEQDPYNFRLFPARQKCMAIQFQFRDAPLPPALTSLEAVELTEMALEVGMKDTLNKTANLAG